MSSLLSPNKSSYVNSDNVGLPPISPMRGRRDQHNSQDTPSKFSQQKSLSLSLPAQDSNVLPAAFSPALKNSNNNTSATLLTSPNGKPLPLAPSARSFHDSKVTTGGQLPSASSSPVGATKISTHNTNIQNNSNAGNPPPIPVLNQNHPSANSANSTASSSTAQIEFVRVNITEEDKLLAMMGYKDLNRSVGPDGKLYFREEFCGACGIIHANPEVLDAYYNCKACHGVIREPSALRMKYRHVKPDSVIEILFATYGDPYDPAFAYEVTEKVKEKMQEFQTLDRLVFRPREQLDLIFGHDPAPGRNKQLRVRYRMHGLHGTLVLDFNPENKIPVPFLLMAPRKQFLRIYAAMYGHPKGATKTGRMCFDVSEILQSFVDQNGGSYLLISTYTPLRRLIGDPCPGYTKDLRIEFEIVGRSGELLYSEIRGHLTKRLLLQTSPCISPILNIQVAFYGITPTARKDRLDFIARQLKRIDMIEHRRRQGLPIQPEDILLLRNRGLLLEQRTIYQNAPTKFIDVSEKLQRIADKSRFLLTLDKDTFDPNAIFGNPNPGQPKILEVLIDCQGHDSERQTDSMEMMDTGFARNYVTVKKNRFNIPVNDIPIYGDEDDNDTIDATNDAVKGIPKKKNKGIRASVTIGGLQMVSIDAPSTLSTTASQLLEGPSVESMLSLPNQLSTSSKKGKRFEDKNNTSSSSSAKNKVSIADLQQASATRLPFANQPHHQQIQDHNNYDQHPTNGTSHNSNSGHMRASLDMGLLGDDFMFGNIDDCDTTHHNYSTTQQHSHAHHVSNQIPPEKPRVLGGIAGGGNRDQSLSDTNSRQNQLLTLQRLQQEYRAQYGGEAEDKERLEATAADAVEPAIPKKIIGYRGVLQETLHFQTDYVAPLIVIKRATYGELKDLNRCIDVTRDIQFMARGRTLEINKDLDLNDVFHKDPSPGRRKQLKIEYFMRGFRGNLRVREKNDCLVANIELGYPPLPPPDDENLTTHDY